MYFFFKFNFIYNLYNYLAIKDEFKVLLESIDMKNKTVKSIDIARPLSQLDPKNSIISIDFLQSSIENSSTLVVCHSDGVLRLFEVCENSLKKSQSIWEKMFESHSSKENWTITKGSSVNGTDIERKADGTSVPRTSTSLPKFGKTDPENKPHIGGNTWAGD
jgi:hypothetical protein